MLSRYQRNEGGGEPSDSVQRSTAVRPMVAELGTWATGLEGGTAGGGKGLRWGGWKGGTLKGSEMGGWKGGTLKESEMGGIERGTLKGSEMGGRNPKRVSVWGDREGDPKRVRDGGGWKGGTQKDQKWGGETPKGSVMGGERKGGP